MGVKNQLVYIFLLIIICTSANGYLNYCYGEECNKPDIVQNYYLQELIVEGILHQDRSVTLSQIMGLSKFKENKVINDSFNLTIFLPFENEYYEDLEITDLINNQEYSETYYFSTLCENKYIFQREQKKIIVCGAANKEHKFKLKITVLPILNYSLCNYCKIVNNIVSNNISVFLPFQPKDYFLSITLKGDLDVAMTNATIFNDNIRKGKAIADIKTHYTTNGVIYQGIFFKNRTGTIDYYVAGENIAKIKEKEQEELNTLSKRNIQASIEASNTAKLNLIITGLLFLVSAVGIIISAKGIYISNRNNEISKENNKISRESLEEVKKSNAPLVSAKLEPLGTSEVVLRIINAGYGTARNIKLKYEVLPKGPKNTWKHHVLQKEDLVRLVIIDNNKTGFPFTEFVKKFDKISIESECEDIYKNKHKDSFDIDLIETRQTIEKNMWLLETTIKEDFENIEKNIKEIGKILENKVLSIDLKKISYDKKAEEEKIKRIAIFLQKQKDSIKNNTDTTTDKKV